MRNLYKMSLSNLNDCNSDDDRPKTPLEEDCCGSGCTPCIFDVHKALIKEWESKKTQDIKIRPSNNILSLLYYKTFIIIDISKTSEDYYIIRLEYPESKIENDASLHLIPGQYVMLHSWYMSRPYTPITWTYKDLVFLVKLYEHGQVSPRLTNALAGSAIDVRGPYGDFKYKSNSIGSGIAALYPIAKALIDNEMELTRIHLIAGFQSIAQVPLRKDLKNLADYWNFKCTLQLSQLNDKTVSLHGFNIKAGRLNKLLVADYLSSNDTDTTLILICGTSEFNQSMKEWLQEMNYMHIYIFE